MTKTVSTKPISKKKEMTAQDLINQFNIQMVPIESLIPSPNNSKIHSDAQVSDIIKSIKEFGFNDPIAIDGSGMIIEGHGRRKALMKMGVKQVPVIILDQMSEAQVKAYRIAHNKLTMKTGFDMDLLFAEMSELQDLGFNVEMTGFTMDEMEGFNFSVPDALTETPSTTEPQELEADPVSLIKDKNKSVVQYILIFENDDQQALWYKFLKHLRENYDGETIAGRLNSFLTTNVEL